MYKLIKIAPLSLILFTSACQEVIEMDVNKSPDKYVIEAYMTNHERQATVTISKSTYFNAENSFQKITNANVVVSGDDIAPTTMLPSADGVYTHPTLKGTPNKTYYLTVIIDGETFKASCKMPPFVQLDDVYSEKSNTFGEKTTDIYVKFDDPKGLGNCYRVKQYINRKYTHVLDVFEDEFFDGNTVKQRVDAPDRGTRSDKKENLQVGDVVRIDFQTISPVIYKYWDSAQTYGAQGGGEGGAASANPISNIVGGALGCFSAHTQQTREIIIK